MGVRFSPHSTGYSVQAFPLPEYRMNKGLFRLRINHILTKHKVAITGHSLVGRKLSSEQKLRTDPIIFTSNSCLNRISNLYLLIFDNHTMVIGTDFGKTDLNPSVRTSG